MMKSKKLAIMLLFLLCFLVGRYSEWIVDQLALVGAAWNQTQQNEEAVLPGLFMSTDEIDTYHLLSCGRGMHQRGTKIYYDSKREAILDGRKPCSLCELKLDAYDEAGLPSDNRTAYYKGYAEGYFEAFGALGEFVGTKNQSGSEQPAETLPIEGGAFLTVSGAFVGGFLVWLIQGRKNHKDKGGGRAGVFSDAKAIANIQRIKNGGIANLSISQITTLVINLPDAKKNLTAKEFDQVYALYKEMRKCKTQNPVDMNGYCATAIKIIKEFDKIAPYEKYSGGNETEFSFMMADIRGKHYEEICQLKERISKTEKGLADYEKTNRENIKNLAEAFTDKELEQMVSRGEFPADRVEEYIKQRRSVEMLVANAPALRKSTEKMLDDMRRELAELEADN